MLLLKEIYKKNNNNFTLNFLEYYLLYKKKKKYLRKYKKNFLSNIIIGNVVFVINFTFEFFKIRKYFFIGLCVGLYKNQFNSNFVLRNVIGGILVEQKFYVFNNLIISFGISRKRFVNLGLKKSKLFFIQNLPFFFRINKFAVLEFDCVDFHKAKKYKKTSRLLRKFRRNTKKKKYKY